MKTKFTKISLSTDQYSDPKLIVKCQLIIDSLTGNPDFPKSADAFADMKAATALFMAMLDTLTKNPHHINVVNKDDARDSLDITFKSLGMFLMGEAKGDAVKLGKTGFTISKPKPNAVVHAPAMPTLIGIRSRTMRVTIIAVRGRDLYLYEYCTAPPDKNTVWVHDTSLKTTIDFENLESGKQYWVRVGATGSGVAYYSAIATQFAV